MIKSVQVANAKKMCTMYGKQMSLTFKVFFKSHQKNLLNRKVNNGTHVQFKKCNTQ